jgi:hypothetical protein
VRLTDKFRTFYLHFSQPAGYEYMANLLKFLLDWSEVWAPLIPLTYFLFHREQPRYMRPVIVYLVIAFPLNLAIDIISEFKPTYVPNEVSNNPLYNLHSVVRFISFVWFFKLLGQDGLRSVRRWLPAVFFLIAGVNAIYFEDPLDPDALNGNLLAAEAYLLLIYCMLYYLYKLRDDDEDFSTTPDFWVVTGLAIFVVVNFFVFLFYVPMDYQDIPLALDIWNVHNLVYIVFCLFLTRSMYGNTRHQLAG